MFSVEESGGPVEQQYHDAELCRMFLHAARAPNTVCKPESRRILAQADLDWDQLTSYLTACGLARPILGATKGLEPQIVPQSFIDRLKVRATQDAVDDLLKREALRHIAGAVREIGTRAVLLKGTALQVLRDSSAALQRATGDIDIYVDPPAGSTLRLRLLERGFSGTADDSRTAPHHLAAVFFRGVAVEIHERIMPSFWGLPEREMLADARPVDGLDSMFTLSPEGLILHAGVHASAHLFAYGLKTAWDLMWICHRFPELEWDRLARWVKACRLSRAFWVPVRVLARELSIPLPVEFLRLAPEERRSSKLETIARHRLFSAIEGPFDLNPFSKTWVFMLLHETWTGRFGYLAALTEATAAEARRSARRHQPSQGRDQVWRQLREAFSQWRQYQRILPRKGPPALRHISL